MDGSPAARRVMQSPDPSRGKLSPPLDEGGLARLTMFMALSG
jgi:hypothetical protein